MSEVNVSYLLLYPRLGLPFWKNTQQLHPERGSAVSHSGMNHTLWSYS